MAFTYIDQDHIFPFLGSFFFFTYLPLSPQTSCLLLFALPFIIFLRRSFSLLPSFSSLGSDFWHFISLASCAESLNFDSSLTSVLLRYGLLLHTISHFLVFHYISFVEISQTTSFYFTLANSII